MVISQINFQRLNIIFGLFLVTATALLLFNQLFKTSPVIIKTEQPTFERKTMLKIESPVFEHNGTIPPKYTCQGQDISPPLTISNIPQGTVSLALITDDPDAPMGTWIHWLVWNIKPTSEIKENTAPGIQGNNSWGRNDYGGPCPPRGTHRYFFKLYALDSELSLPEGASKAKLETAINGHILDQAELIGLYQKS